MLKNILNHKKKLIVVVLLLTLIGVSAYVLLNKEPTVKTTTEKTSEVSAKEDKKNEVKTDKTDKKNETKTSDKKEDVKTDDKKADTKTEETSTSTENTTSTTPVAPKNDTPTNSQSTTTNPAPTPCVPTYTTVTHPAVGHYEQREIMPAYNKPIYAEKIVGLTTGRTYNSVNEFLSQDEDGNYTVTQVQVGTEYVPAEYDNVWVEDQPAYTTTEASGC